MKKLAMVLGLISALSLTTISVMAESTIYTDGLGRMHFLGKDAASNKGTRADYTNPEQQDLTRQLYENTSNEVNYVDRPLKNYENTFSDFRFSNWQKKFQSNVDDARVNVDNKTKSTFSAEKGANDASNPYGYASTNIKTSEQENNTKEKSSFKWFNKKSN